MESDEEKAAIHARLINIIQRKEPAWQEASLSFFLLKASELPAPEHEMVARSEPPATPPVIYLPGSTSVADKPDKARIKPSHREDRGVIGQDIETGTEVCIGDEERCAGLYVPGKPRTGKSNLLLRLALSDINNGRGILFIDPHTDAINDLRDRIPDFRRDDVILLNPTDKERSFGIDLLRCEDRENPLALDAAWGRIRDIFVKVWEQERGQLGFWLDKILRNSVYILLENPGVTMVELPLLLRKDPTFRDSLLANMKIKPFVKDFWHYEFDRLSERDRTEQVGPALNRLSLLRDIDIVRDIVGQGNPKINFRDILRDNKIVLLRLSVNLSM